MKLGDTALVQIDGRTKEARLIREFKRALLAQVGERPSRMQLAMIDQATQLKLRLAMADRRLAETGGQSRREKEVYNATLAGLRGIIRDLGGPPAAAPSKPIALREYLERRNPASHPPPPPRAA